MIDKQPSATPALTGIPFVSPLLHVLSMPVVVFFRYGFGYSYLRPKAVFLAVAWACFLLSYIVWKEPGMHSRFGAPALFSSITALLYLLHLAWSFIKETRSDGQHDQFSGHSLLLIPLGSTAADSKAERNIHMLVEPLAAFIAGVSLGMFGFSGIGFVLIVAAFSLFAKEAINAWLTKRRKKLIADKLKEAEGTIEQPSQAPPPASSRKPRQPRPSAERRE
jgi:hypothetical protein